MLSVDSTSPLERDKYLDRAFCRVCVHDCNVERKRHIRLRVTSERDMGHLVTHAHPQTGLLNQVTARSAQCYAQFRINSSAWLAFIPHLLVIC